MDQRGGRAELRSRHARVLVRRPAQFADRQPANRQVARTGTAGRLLGRFHPNPYESRTRGKLADDQLRHRIQQRHALERFPLCPGQRNRLARLRQRHALAEKRSASRGQRRRHDGRPRDPHRLRQRLESAEPPPDNRPETEHSAEPSLRDRPPRRGRAGRGIELLEHEQKPAAHGKLAVRHLQLHRRRTSVQLQIHRQPIHERREARRYAESLLRSGSRQALVRKPLRIPQHIQPIGTQPFHRPRRMAQRQRILRAAAGRILVREP